MNEFATLRQAAGLDMRQAARLLGCSLTSVYRWERTGDAPSAALSGLRAQIAASVHPAGAFTFIDLFAGIGGLRRGFEAIDGRCVFTSEWDRFARLTYQKNFRDGPDHIFAGDIRKVDPADVPDHDVLLAGFPCQPFSIAGVSKKNALGRLHGFKCDAQGTLFFDLASIIERKRPKVILLENVKNLLSHDRGRTFAVIRSTLEDELGYTISRRVIDARCFVPQHRERIFIAGVRKDLELSIDLDALELPTQGPRLGSILHPEDGSEAPDPAFIEDSGRVHAKYTLTAHLWGYLQGYAEKHRAKGNGFGFGKVGPGDVTRTLSARYFKDGSEILVDQGPARNPRRLTPRECARLMGFDAPGDSEWEIPVSDTQAYRQFGNAVVVPVVEAVARHMAPVIREAVGASAERELALQCG